MIDFIDELTDTIHAYVFSMSAPIHLLKFSKIFMESYKKGQSASDGDYTAAIAFIEKNGQVMCKKIQDHLDKARPLISKIESLKVKGQVFSISDYKECCDACEMLRWSFERIQTFSGIVGSSSLNWDNPKVREAVENTVMSINSDAVAENLEKQNGKYILFAKQAYKEVL